MVKKICHLTSAHTRYDLRILKKQCVSLAKSGYDVTLIVNDNKEDEVYQGVKIISTNFVSKNRLERMIKSKNKIYKKAIQVDADIYHFHDPDLLVLGNKLKRKQKKVIFDSHEDVPEQIKDKQWIPKILRNIISKIYEVYEKKSVKKYDAVISVTPHIVERFLTINKNTFLVTNYPILDKDIESEQEKNNSICFAGGITEQWNHDKVILAVNNIKELKYVLAGSGPKEYIESLKKTPGWEKVDFKGRVTHEEVKKIYQKSIAGIALNYSIQARKEGTLGNTKIFEYMNAGIPVICTNYSLWKEIIEGNNCGICVNPNNIDEVTEAIKYLVNNHDQANEMGNNGRLVTLKKYNWKTQEKVLIDIYCDMFKLK